MGRDSAAPSGTFISIMTEMKRKQTGYYFRNRRPSCVAVKCKETKCSIDEQRHGRRGNDFTLRGLQGAVDRAAAVQSG